MQVLENDNRSRELHELYVSDRARLFRFARSYLRDDAAAEDIVMDSFMQFWEHRDTLHDGVSPLPYLFTIVRNRCLNHLKSKRVRDRAHGVIADTESRVLDLQISSITACDPKELFDKESQQIVSRAIAELPPRTREVFMRSMFHDQSYRQIKAEMNMTSGTVDHEIRRAKKILAEKIRIYRPDLLAVVFFMFL